MGRMGTEGRKEGLRERERGMNKCMYYKHANEGGGERAGKRARMQKARKEEEGREREAVSLSLALHSTSTSKAKLQRMKGRVVF